MIPQLSPPRCRPFRLELGNLALIADAEMRDILGVIYISKCAAVASIRAMQTVAEAGRQFFNRGKELRWRGPARWAPKGNS